MFPLYPNVPPLFSLAVKSFEFLPCDSTPQAECFYILHSQHLVITVKHSSLTVRATEVSNLIGSPHFRSSVSIHSQVSAFALDVPTLMRPFYRYWSHSLTHTMIQESLFLYAGLINQTLTIGTKETTYLLFMPSPKAQHSPSLYYRGGWHRVSQGFYLSSFN